MVSFLTLLAHELYAGHQILFWHFQECLYKLLENEMKFAVIAVKQQKQIPRHIGVRYVIFRRFHLQKIAKFKTWSL